LALADGHAVSFAFFRNFCRQTGRAASPGIAASPAGGGAVYSGANSGYNGRCLVARTIVRSDAGFQALSAPGMYFRLFDRVGSYVSPFLFGPGK
jgi:hypothetical protein